jgi:hypothetical protein
LQTRNKKCERKKLEKKDVIIVAYEQGKKGQPKIFARSCTKKKKESLDFDMKNKKKTKNEIEKKSQIWKKNIDG